MTAKQVLSMIKEKDIKFIDLRFTDLRGKEHHVTMSAERIDADLFENGKVFDGSSIDGWATIDKSDMVMKPLAETAVLDPFMEVNTLILRCDIYSPVTGERYNRDPRGVAERAEAYLKSTGVADAANFGQEIEFFIFDDVRWSLGINGASYHVDSQEAAWNSDKEMVQGNTGHRPGIKGGYFPVPPVDSSQDIRSDMCLTLSEMGLVPEVHHHEVATSNQNEIITRFNTLLKKADEIQVFKYVVRNVANAYGKTATFLPKPLIGDNGSAFHCHQSLSKDKKNLFAGEQYGGLSDMALYYVGGLLKHARALNAFTNPGTNSYKRLVPGFEAPTKIAYSKSNRSAAVRIPHVASEQEVRLEARFPDPLANPYLALSAILMAGMDGIKHKIHPGEAFEENLYEHEKSESVPELCATLTEAIAALEADHAFLLEGNVFDKDLIDAYLELKRAEVARLNSVTHPVEFDMYYSM